jgi:phytoene dehydrogenase-like protein
MNVAKYDTIIVGGGIAGLTSAAYIARAGQKVLLIEKNDEFGGLVNSFVSDGFHFEAGVRALENAGIILPMLKDLGIDLEYVRSKVSVGVEDKILNIEDLNSVNDYRDLLAELYPESTDDVDRFVHTMRKIMKLLDVLYGIENPIFKDLKKDKEYIFKTLLPWLPKFIMTVGKINKLKLPFEVYLGKLIKNSSLIDIIAQHFFKGTPTFFALSYFSLYLDYLYPKGGVGKLAQALENKIRESEGVLLPGTLIQKVEAARHIITDDKGNNYQYDNLIWAADLKSFYNNTLTDGLDAKTINNFETTKSKVNLGKGSESIFSLYLQVDLPLSYFSNIARGHFFYTPSKKGLGNLHRSDLRFMLDKWDKTEKGEVYRWLFSFLHQNTFEISIPGLKDPDLVPEGKTGVIVSFLVEYELFKKLQDRGWYEDIRKEIETEIVDILNETVYPGLKEKVEKMFSFTPVSIKNRIASTDGAVVGWSFEAQVPAVHKIEKSAEAVNTPIANIFQAGQWVYNPAGVPMSILTGKLAADKIIKLSRS